MVLRMWPLRGMMAVRKRLLGGVSAVMSGHQGVVG